MSTCPRVTLIKSRLTAPKAAMDDTHPDQNYGTGRFRTRVVFVFFPKDMIVAGLQQGNIDIGVCH